jgi:hypothetical protein
MQETLHLKTTVLPGGRIEVANLALPTGVAVDLLVLARPPASSRRSALDVLAEAPGRRLFQNAEEVDRYIQAERDSWDRPPGRTEGGQHIPYRRSR